MKKMILATLVAFSATAWANDASIPYIEVENLTFKKMEVGSSITFEGKEAESLMNAFPSTTVTPNGVSRGLTITGKVKSVGIECGDEIWDGKKYVKAKNPPLCTIYVGKALDRSPKAMEDSDAYKWTNSRDPQSEKPADKKSKK